MAKSYKAIARKYLKAMHGSKEALRKASAEYHGGNRRDNPGTNWGKIALIAGAGYVAYKVILPNLQQPKALPPATDVMGPSVSP